MKTLIVRLSESEFAELAMNYGGVCLRCGEITYSGCEPDARRYPCDDCGKNGVYGVEEALIMGRIEFTEEA
jgi:hypothetical protein